MPFSDNLQKIILASLLSFLIFLLLSPINLTTADLGRHIKNGEVILNGNFEVLYKNLYSYTYPDFPFVNHHWGSGVLFYLVYQLSGFTGLHIFYLLVSLLTFLIFFDLARKYSNFYTASIVSLLIITVIAYRNEIRPEALSYLFAGIYFWVLQNYTQNNLSKKYIYILPFMQLLWVNLHVYFFLGFLITAVFGLQTLIAGLITKKSREPGYFKNLTLVSFLMLLTSLVNPNFINGLIYPLQIYGSYGYRVLENQSIFFLQKLISVPAILYFEIALSLLILSWLYAIWIFLYCHSERIRRISRLILRSFANTQAFGSEAGPHVQSRRDDKKVYHLSVSNLLFSIIFSYLAITQIRNFALFGFFAISLISMNLKDLRLSYSKYALVPVMAVLLLVLLVINPSYWEKVNFGIGLSERVEKSAEFFKQNNLKGPIFNNYDIGSYLIFELYPRELVFTDNRPETYPKDFFQNEYIPIQEDEAKWKEAEEKYKFNSIYFMRNDLTPWAQNFLISRVKGKTWAPIYVDPYTIIFLKRNDQNIDLIKKYELPREIFKTST